MHQFIYYCLNLILLCNSMTEEHLGTYTRSDAHMHLASFIYVECYK